MQGSEAPPAYDVAPREPYQIAQQHPAPCMLVLKHHQSRNRVA